MMRRVAFLLIGAVFLGLGGTMLSFSLAALVRGGAAELNLFVLVPAVFVVLGLVLVITSLRGMMRSRERRAMPLAPVRPAPDTSILGGLTERERELFALAARGLSNAEIAKQLWVAETTVKTHMRAILTKLGVASRVQLIALAYEHRLIEA